MTDVSQGSPYQTMVTLLLAVPKRPDSTQELAQWRKDSGALVVTIGDAGVNSVSALFGTVRDAVHVSDRHHHRWRERLRLSGRTIAPTLFPILMSGGHSQGVSAQTMIYSAATSLARVNDKSAIVVEAQPGAGFWNDPCSADLLLVASSDHADRVREQIRLVATPESTVVMAPQRESIADAVREATREVGATLEEVASRCKIGKIEPTENGQRFTIEIPAGRYTVEVPVPGAHQRTNLATALLASSVLSRDAIDAKGIAARLKYAELPLRLESIKTSPRTLADSASSRLAYRALEQTLREAAIVPSLIIATLDAETNIDDLATTLQALGAEVRLAFARVDRPIADALAQTLRDQGVALQLAGDPGSALDQALAGAGSRDTILVFGARRPTADARAYLLGLEQDPV
jgi:hypothetical protein